MKTKKWILLTVLLLAAGCSNAPDTNRQAAPNESNAGAQAQSTGSTLTQASSISTEDLKKSSMQMQQASNEGTHWFDWFNLGDRFQSAPQERVAYPNQPPVQTTNPQQAPVKNTNPQPAPVRNTNPQPAPVRNTNPQPAPVRNTNPQPAADASQFPQQVLDLVNQERAKAGLSSLSMNSELSRMAMDKAQDMYNNNYFDHNSPTYGSPFDMMNSYGIRYNTAAENIAKGQRSATEVMNSWMNSQGHRANILNGSFSEIGVAYYNGEWVQVFIG
ncbi:CAP domain-containing protein [Paenibacillus turpanensis]|uniref:CAP domain-containing protein n=1 Tax=Paenibacillus turpanensis TaxID=2689078 RepID=UPI0014088C4E|nr:CAP domain-containing protein [Paenibacillus turpanensis]